MFTFWKWEDTENSKVYWTIKDGENPIHQIIDNGDGSFTATTSIDFAPSSVQVTIDDYKVPFREMSRCGGRPVLHPH